MLGGQTEKFEGIDVFEESADGGAILATRDLRSLTG